MPTYAEFFPCLWLAVPWTADEELGLSIAKKKLQKSFTTCLQIYLQEVQLILHVNQQNHEKRVVLLYNF